MADLDETTAVAPSLALGDAQKSLDAAADWLRQPLSAVPRRKRGRDGPGTADELYVKRCRTNVDAFVDKVDEAYARIHREHVVVPSGSEAGPAVVATQRRTGERLVMQARALRRAMLGPAGLSGQARRGDGDDSRTFRMALERLDAALADADRLKAEACDGGNDNAAFTKAAQEASRAAQELQRAGETSAREAEARADGARVLVRLALGEMDELEFDVKASGFDNEPTVTTALRVARRELERTFRKLGGIVVAGDEKTSSIGYDGQSQDRVQAQVASGTLESALGTVDVARAELTRVRKMSDLQAKARAILSEEDGRVGVLSREAATTHLLRRPEVAQVLQRCRAALTIAERYDTRGKKLSLEKREALAQDYMAAALTAAEARSRAEEVLFLERENAARNEQEKAHLLKRLEPAKAAVSNLRDRVERISGAAIARRASLEKARLTAASWNVAVYAGEATVSRGALPQEPDGATAARQVAEGLDSVDALLARANEIWDMESLSEEIMASLQRVVVADGAVAAAEVHGRRRDNAFAALERATAKTQSVITDARSAKVDSRPIMTESLALAVRDLRIGFIVAADTARRQTGPGKFNADDVPLLDAASAAEDSAESAASVLAKERLLVEQAERGRQVASSELWLASRRLEELDTDGVVGDDPEAAAMVLEARSEVVQVWQAGVVWV